MQEGPGRPVLAKVPVLSGRGEERGALPDRDALELAAGREAVMFRIKRSINVSEKRQGYIYYVSLLYPELPEKKRAQIREICRRAGGEYAPAVLEFVTTDQGAIAVSQKHYISRETLDRAVRRYYEMFPKDF